MRFKNYLAELAHLSDEKFEDLLTQDMVVNWKIDQCAFVIMRDGDTVRFYGKDGVEEIDEIKQIGMSLYTDAIKHVQTAAWKKLPDKWKFFTECFNDSLKSVVKYKEHPLMVMSYAKDETGAVIKPNDPAIAKACAALDIDVPPVVFEGKLSAAQRKALSGFASADVEDRVRGEEFRVWLEELFPAPADKEWLSSGDKAEGLVLYFDEKQAKVVDPEYTEKLMKKKESASTDFSKFMIEMMYSTGFDIILAVNTGKYVDTLIAATKEITKKHSSEFSAAWTLLSDEVDKQKFTSVDVEKVPDLAELFKEKPWTEELFSWMLFSLRKEKTRTNEETGLSEERLKKLNDVVRAIA